jgi:hypothetical protein
MAAITAGNQQMSRKFEEVQLKQLETDKKIENLTTRHDEVERRLTALELKPVVPPLAFPPAVACPSAASGSAAPSRASSTTERGRDPLYEADPWAKGRGKGRPAPPPKDLDFQPSRAWLRGWSPYHKDFGQRRSISQESAKGLVDSFLTVVPQTMRDHISVIDPSYRNFQVSVVLKESMSRDSAFRLASLVKRAGLTVTCEGVPYPVYLAVEQEPWRVERTRHTKAAVSALKSSYPSCADRLHEDLNLG